MLVQLWGIYPCAAPTPPLQSVRRSANRSWRRKIRSLTLQSPQVAPQSYLPFLCPFRLCCFITVRAATSFARLPYRPERWADLLICSYCRCSFEPTPRRCLLTAIFHLFIFYPLTSLNLALSANAPRLLLFL